MQLLYSYASNVAPTAYRQYTFHLDKAGNMQSYNYDNGNMNVDYFYTYNGDQRVYVTGSKHLDYDLNGRQTSLWQDYAGDFPVKYDWDGRIQWNKGLFSYLTTEAKSTPDKGIRIWKKYNWNLDSYEHKFIVDMVGNVPQILVVVDVNDGARTIFRTYVSTLIIR